MSRISERRRSPRQRRHSAMESKVVMDRIDIKDIRRTQLIKATIESIEMRGFARTTLAHVAEHAHLSHGIVNFYFKSKDDLLIATLRQMVNEYEAFSMSAVERAGPSPVARLSALIDADFDPAIVDRRKVTVWYAFWGETRWREDFQALCSTWSAAYFERVRGLVRDLIELGGYRIDSGAVARGLVAMLDGLWLDILLNVESSPDQARQCCRLYLAGLFPREFEQNTESASAA